MTTHANELEWRSCKRLELATADLPIGIYVVRARLGDTVRTTRLAVVR